MSLKHTLNIFQYDMTQLQLVKWICQVRIEALFGSKTSYIFKHMSLRGEHFCEQLFRFNRSRKRGHFFGGYLDIPKKRVVQSLSKQGVCVKKSLSYESHVLFLQTRSLYLDLLSLCFIFNPWSLPKTGKPGLLIQLLEFPGHGGTLLIALASLNFCGRNRETRSVSLSQGETRLQTFFCVTVT